MTQLRFKLNAAKQRNKRLSENMAKLPGIISIIGSTPIVDVNTKSAELQLIPFTQLHKYVGSYYAKSRKYYWQKVLLYGRTVCGIYVKTCKRMALQSIPQADWAVTMSIT